MVAQAVLEQNSPSEPVSVADTSNGGFPAADVVLPAAQPDEPRRAKTKRRKTAAGSSAKLPPLELSGDVRPARQRPSDQGRKHPEGAPSVRRQQRDDLLNYTPRASVPSDRSSATVVTEHAYGLFARHYGRALVSLYNLFEYLPVLLRKHGMSQEQSLEVVGNIEEHVNSTIVARLKANVDEKLAEIRLKAGDAAVERPANWTVPPRTLSLPIYAPQVVDLMETLGKFDEFAAYYKGMWLAREISVKEREKAINSLRNAIVVEIRVLMRLYTGAKEFAVRRDPTALTKAFGPFHEADLPEELSAEDEATAAAMVEAAHGESVSS